MLVPGKIFDHETKCDLKPKKLILFQHAPVATNSKIAAQKLTKKRFPIKQQNTPGEIIMTDDEEEDSLISTIQIVNPIKKTVEK